MGKARNNVCLSCSVAKARQVKVADVGGIDYFTIRSCDIQGLCGFSLVGNVNIGQKEMSSCARVSNSFLDSQSDVNALWRSWWLRIV